MEYKSPVYQVIPVPIEKIQPNTYNPNTVAPLSLPAAARRRFFSPCPWNILSPRIIATESSPIKSAPMMNAWARPSGLGCTAYCSLAPN